MKELFQTSQYKNDLKKCAKSGKYKINDLLEVLTFLVEGRKLPEKYKDHLLTGNWHEYRECHIKADWLLIYKETKTSITLVRLGSHSELF